MSERVEADLEVLPMELFHKTLDSLSHKPGKKYRFITDAGTSLKSALFNLFSRIWECEQIPESWHESTVIQLKKGKSKENDFNDIRHIHDRNIFSKFLSHMVLSEAKPILFENLTKYQIACRPGHGASEHLFVLKSVLAKY